MLSDPRKTYVQKLFSPNGWSWMPNLTSFRNYNKNAKLKKDLCRLENFELSHTGSRYKVMQNHHFLLLSLNLWLHSQPQILIIAHLHKTSTLSQMLKRKNINTTLLQMINLSIKQFLPIYRKPQWIPSIYINIDYNGIVFLLLSVYALLHCWLHL